jgi:hypothetical protein
MLSFEHLLFLSGVGLALLHVSLANPAELQNPLFPSFANPIKNMPRHTRDLFSPNEKYEETYLLKVKNNTICLQSPIELEWTASANHNSQVRAGKAL